MYGCNGTKRTPGRFLRKDWSGQPPGRRSPSTTRKQSNTSEHRGPQPMSDCGILAYKIVSLDAKLSYVEEPEARAKIISEIASVARQIRESADAGRELLQRQIDEAVT